MSNSPTFVHKGKQLWIDYNESASKVTFNPNTKGWSFDTLLTLDAILLDDWREMTSHDVLIDDPNVPYPIILIEFEATPLGVNALM